MATPLPEQRTTSPPESASARPPLATPAPHDLRPACALVVLATLAIVAALKLGQAVIVPVLFALFVALLLSPAVEALARRRVPRVAAATLVMCGLLTIVGAALNATWDPAREWLDTAPATLQKLERKLRPVTRFIAKVESVSTQAGQMTEPEAARGEAPAPVALETKGLVQNTREYALTVVSMTFLTFFLLVMNLGSLGRGPPGSPWAGVGEIFLRVRGELGRYFGAVTLSNLALGVGTAATMYWLEMPNALLWGVVAFTLNFIPYAGSATTLLLLTAVALVSFDGVGKAASVAGTYLVLTTFEGQVLQPVVVGRRLDISPPVVLLGLWFGGWLWGVAGIALAMPLLVSIKAAVTEVARSRAVEQTEADPETVRSRAFEWLKSNRGRYRRAKRPGHGANQQG